MPRVALLVAAVLFSAPAAPPFPVYFAVPPAMAIVPNYTVDENYAEAWMPFENNDNAKRGRHLAARFKFDGVETSDDNSWRPRVWNPIRDALTGSGWVVKEYQDTNPPMATLQYQRNGIEAWTRLRLFSPEQIDVDLIEVKTFTPTLTVRAPAAMPEAVAENAPFPFLTPLPGAQAGRVDADNGAMYVTFKGDESPTLVAAASVKKDYQDIQGISNLQFILEYRSALTKAGWQIVDEYQGGDAAMTAHYARNGRDIWAYLHFGGTELSITVGEAGDLASALKKECHVPLYGVTFDFNKTTLRADSEGVLQRVLAVLQADAPLTVEVQGHTDNVGGDAYNQTLSQGRADAVKAWLVAHGIGGNRISARGYGRQQPIASNDSDDGRAKNRRVELARTGCQ